VAPARLTRATSPLRGLEARFWIAGEALTYFGHNFLEKWESGFISDFLALTQLE